MSMYILDYLKRSYNYYFALGKPFIGYAFGLVEVIYDVLSVCVSENFILRFVWVDVYEIEVIGYNGLLDLLFFILVFFGVFV